MTWNYRVIRKTETGYDNLGEFFGIHEVYYDDDGNPEMVTVEPIGPAGDTFEELLSDVECMVAALKKPVLNYDDIRIGWK